TDESTPPDIATNTFTPIQATAPSATVTLAHSAHHVAVPSADGCLSARRHRPPGQCPIAADTSMIADRTWAADRTPGQTGAARPDDAASSGGASAVELGEGGGDRLDGLVDVGLGRRVPEAQAQGAGR